ncbi:hypothetical protein LQZ19_08445 [Treponema primitia]|uniref:hypothetical protein n=1 Tax=Treponema primitia TaxID=88058 RepID=UPI0039811449
MPLDMFRADIDTDKLDTAFRMFPAETQKMTARLLNDMAFAFKEIAPGVIDKHLTVRNKSFVASRFKVQKANPSQKPGDQESIAGSEYIEGDSTHGAFTGWIEQMGGKADIDTGGREHRLIGLNARGGSMTSQAKPKARMGGKAGHVKVDSEDLTGLPEGSRVQAAINMVFRSQGGDGRVILSGGGFRRGLYQVKEKKNGNPPDVAILQDFTKPIRPRRFDWRAETAERVRAWFGSDYIFEHYMVTLLSRLWK